MEAHIIDGVTCRVISHGGGPVIYMGMQSGSAGQLQEIAGEIGESECPYTIAAYEAQDWSGAFSPWRYENEKQSFTGNGGKTLSWMLNSFVPFMEMSYGAAPGRRSRMIAGYSLAGLFSLWAFYESGAFYGAASCSGSLWYPAWEKYSETHTAKEEGIIYLSLGTNEERTRNAVMAAVGERTRMQLKAAENDRNITAQKLEMNPGGHFKDAGQRIARGITWLVKNFK